MNANVFLDRAKPTLTVMVQADNPHRIMDLMDQSMPLGAEAFGIQFEQMRPEDRTPQVYRQLFAHAKEKPLYVTNYRCAKNTGKSDVCLADELLEIAECGADLCDVMGDYFDPQVGEMTYQRDAVEKQKALIQALHAKGAKVLMSSHIFHFTPAQEVLKVALAHQERGADICKIVVGAENPEQEVENLRIICMLKEKLRIPFLFLSGGACALLRRVGGALGCCMILCVYEHDDFSTQQQPLLREVKQIRELIPNP